MSNTEDIENLWKQLIDDPEKIYRDKSIDNDTLIKLSKKINPYSYQKPISEDETTSDISKVALLSYTNLDEDYQRRFQMTSLVGFIFRMFDEYNVDEVDRQWNTASESDKKFRDKETYSMMSYERMEANTKIINKYIREYKSKMDEYNEQLDALKKVKEAGKKVDPKDEADLHTYYEKKFLAIRFILNHHISDMGDDSKRRLETLVENCNKNPNILSMTIDDAEKDAKILDTVVEEYNAVRQKAELLKNKILAIEVADGEVEESDRKLLKTFEQDLLKLNYKVSQEFIRFGEEAKYRQDATVRVCSKYPDIMETIRDSGYKPKEKDTIITLPEYYIKEQIGTFLKKYFEYNPDEHVRSSFDEDKLSKDSRYDQHDPSRPTMKLLKAKSETNDTDLKEILENRETYNSVMYLLNKKPDLLKTLANDPDGYREKLTPIREANELVEHIPPADTFHRWGYYSEVNMEEIRNVVSTIYHEKPLLDFALIVYDTFEGNDEEIKAFKKKWVAKHNEELCSDLKVVKFDNWTMLGNFKENRKEIDFFNRHTEVLRRIMDKHEEDKKLGKDLMMKRVKKTKAKNVKEAGRDAEIMKEYMSQVQNLADLGAKRALTNDEQREIEAAQKMIADMKEVEDVPDNAIQVDVFTHDTGDEKFVKTSFYTESEAPMTGEEIEDHMAKAYGLKKESEPVKKQEVPAIKDNV